VRVDRLVCTQFRNLEPLDLSFAPGANLFLGANGQGKTNILEAIQFFKFGRSFRTSRDGELIRFGAEFCRAEATCTFQAGNTETFAASIERGGVKKIKIHDKEIPRLSELVGRFPCVLFGPDDLRVVSGAPADRRRLVDMVGSMTDPAYIRCAREYKRVLLQRNAALKSRANEYEVNIWNEQIVVAGAELITHRRALVAALEDEVNVHAEELHTPFEFDLSYESALLREAGTMAAGAAEENNLPTLADIFAIKLGALEYEERRRGTTLAGPHRDDVVVNLAGRDLRKYGSQGQRRLFAVLLKLAELSYLEKHLREPCALLLDDVFSEFDRDIMGQLQHVLDGKRQVFVTSPVELEWAKSENAREFRVAGGKVEGQA
jgi:DNA replication and repair protein RecF